MTGTERLELAKRVQFGTGLPWQLVGPYTEGLDNRKLFVQFTEGHAAYRAAPAQERKGLHAKQRRLKDSVLGVLHEVVLAVLEGEKEDPELNEPIRWDPHPEIIEPSAEDVELAEVLDAREREKKAKALSVN